MSNRADIDLAAYFVHGAGLSGRKTFTQDLHWEREPRRAPHPGPLPQGEGAGKDPHPGPLPLGEGRARPSPSPLSEGEGV